MTIGHLTALASGVWLLSCGLSLVAMYWSIKRNSQRAWPSLLLSAIGLLVGYLGWSHIHLTAFKTVNGHVVWSFNSNRLFLGAIVLGVCALAAAAWNCKKGGNRTAAALGTTGAVEICGDEPDAPPHNVTAAPLGTPVAQQGHHR